MMIQSIFSELENKKKYIENIPRIGLIPDDITCSEDKLFNILLDLFSKLDVLETNVQDDSKFTFLYAYPDEPYEQDNLVTYEIKSKKPHVSSNSTIKGRSTNVTHYRAEEREEKYNTVSGCMDVVYQKNYDMIVALQCFSPRNRSLSNLVKLVESIIIKNTGAIKRPVNGVDELLYLGYGPITFISANDKKRLLVRQLIFQVKISETFVVSREQLKDVDISIN